MKYQTTTSGVTGAIKIKLPTHGTADMMTFVVDIYDYTSNESATIFIAGYLYQTTNNNEWNNCTVRVIANQTGKDYTVRFGADGSNNCVWIGETNSTWSYPQVMVRDFFGAYTADIDAYNDNWDITFVTSFDTVDETRSDNLPAADWDRIEGKPGNATTSANGLMSSTDKTKLDGIATGANNYVHPTTAGNKHIPSGGSAGQFLKYSSSGTAVWATPSYTTNTNTQLSNEQVQDIVGAMFSGNTESNITATYQDGDGTIDLAVAANYGSWDLVADDDTTFRVDSTEHVKFQGASITGTGTQADPFLVNTPDTNTTYTADGNYGMTLSGTAFRLENDRRRNSTTQDIYTGNTHDYTFYDASVGIRWYTAGAEEMRLEDDGDLHVDGDVIAFSTTVSDERLKDNVETIDNAIHKVKQLRGVEYTWNEGSRKGQREIGVIAQEVEKVVPEIVHEKRLPFVGDETYKTVDYEKLVALLIESNKELVARVETLEAKLDGTTK